MRLSTDERGVERRGPWDEMAPGDTDVTRPAFKTRTMKMHAVLAKYEQAREAAHRAIETAFPVGAQVGYHYERGEGVYQVHGWVIAHSRFGSDMRVRVQNESTGKLRWVEPKALYMRFDPCDPRRQMRP